MGWQTPKTNWDSLYIPGPSDLNRIEGNTLYLKDEIAKDGLFVLPSDTVIMAADVERGGSGVVKKFRVKYEGKYRITCEAKAWYTSVNYSARVIYRVGGFSTEHSIPWDNQYRVYSSDIYIPASEVVEILLQAASGGEYSYIYIRNARVKGTLMTRSDVPSNAVLQN